MTGLLDYFMFRQQQAQDEYHKQALMDAMKYGAPSDQVNITPRVQQQQLMMPSSQGPMPNGAASAPMAGQGGLMPGASINPLNPSNLSPTNQIAQRVAPGAYQGPAPPGDPMALLAAMAPADAAKLVQGIVQDRMNPKAQSALGQLSQDKTRGLVSPQDYTAFVNKETYIPGQGPESPLGKLADDFKKGRISKADYETGVAKENNIPGSRPAAPIIHEFTEGDKTVTKQWNASTNQWDKLSEGDRYKPAQPQPEFGRGMEGRSYEILKNGLKDPSVLSTPEYATAWAIVSNPKVDPNTGTIVTPDMSAFKPPNGGGSAPGQPGAAPPQRRPSVQSFAPPNPSQPEAASAGFANRLDAANKVFEDPAIASAFKDPVNKAAAGVPLVGNYLVGKDFQKADQAQRNFINAQLRRESGAVISDEEFDNARKQYFPQPGDKPEALAQKKANRDMAVRNMQLSAGNVLLPPGVVQDSSPPRGAPSVPQQQGFGASPGGDIPTVSTPEEAMKLPPGTQFRTPDGRLKVR